ncbi:hypothetical protein Nepgr_018246 [Nepenthes gracilis]|uniref:Uncharacterized protein n=1 Tax=Nepenthes gracilis TaxID=150966 RepID=A0AAD3ST04_NEPGR|nr:hypothetical protein Nepgr_018246 [Nepenthes gracilis]
MEVLAKASCVGNSRIAELKTRGLTRNSDTRRAGIDFRWTEHSRGVRTCIDDQEKNNGRICLPTMLPIVLVSVLILRPEFQSYPTLKGAVANEATRCHLHIECSYYVLNFLFG